MADFTEQKLCLRRQSGAQRYENVPCILRQLSRADMDEVKIFHDKIVKSTSRELFAPTSDEDLDDILSGNGVALGVTCEDRLICMRLLIFESHVPEADESAGFLPWEHEKTCFMDHCVVDRDFRGNNLQFLTYYLMENMLWGKFDSITTTVSPLNIFSLRNVLQCGYYAFDLRECYGGYMRFHLRKGLTNQLVIDASSYSRARITDYDRQRTFLAQWKVGYRINHNSAGSWMLYAPVDGMTIN